MSSDNGKCGDPTDRVPGETLHDVDVQQADDERGANVQSNALPRPKRRRHKAKVDRGLPPDNELATLATAFLERQRKLWPKIVEAGLLPEPHPVEIKEMVDDFKDRHRTGRIDVAVVRPYVKLVDDLAGSYNRYSCENSNPLSVLDQMVKTLDKAHSEGRFIPWQYVFADFSVTGLDSTRQGYSSYKTVLADKASFIETTYIDDFTRASREEIEWWKLASLSKRLNKRMVGASDGFDLSSPNSDVMISIYSLLSRLFIKGLRHRSKRGMAGAARRRTCIGKLPLGFTRRECVDQSGNIIRGPDGLPIYEPCIDPATREFRLLMFELFVERGWTAYRISQHFSHLKVDGWDGWSSTAISNLLRSPSAIGVFIWNKFRQEANLDTGKKERIQNPRSEWVVKYDPKLAIAPMEWYRAARRKLAEKRRASPLTGRKPTRNQSSATTLFSGTLFCECGEEIKLDRSTRSHKQMACVLGRAGRNGCKVSSSKSVRMIEKCLLDFIRESLLGDHAIESLVTKANRFLDEEARKPQIDIVPLKAEIRDREGKIEKNIRQIEETDDKELATSFRKRVIEHQQEINRLRASIREAELHNSKDVRPLDFARVKSYVDKLHVILQGDVSRAAEVIRNLTGPITIRQEHIPGRARAHWIAKFSPNFLAVLRTVANDDPEAALLFCIPIGEHVFCEVVIVVVPKYERLLPKTRALLAAGASVSRIAAELKMNSNEARDAINFAKTGERPVSKSRCKAE